jgi:hypothetical protein
MPGGEAAGRERLALTSLAVAASEKPGELVVAFEHVYPDVTLLSVGDAVHELAGLWKAGENISPRLTVFDLLVEVAVRNRDALPTVDDRVLDTLLTHCVEDRRHPIGPAHGDLPGRGPDVLIPPPPRRPLGPDDIPRLRNTLRDLPDIALPKDPWRQFVDEMGTMTTVRSGEVHRPVCTDTVAEDGSTVIETTFTLTDACVADMRYWADPHNWPHCCSYFKKMREHPGSRVVHRDGWDVDIDEVVEVVPSPAPRARRRGRGGGRARGQGQGIAPGELVTPLHFCYREASNGTWVHTTYDLVNKTPTVQILVDNGIVEATATGANPADPPVEIHLRKTIEFADELSQALTPIACKIFFLGLAQEMAVVCQGRRN